MRHKPQCLNNDTLGNPKHESIREIKNCCFLFSLTDLSAIDLTAHSNSTKKSIYMVYLILIIMIKKIQKYLHVNQNVKNTKIWSRSKT